MQTMFNEYILSQHYDAPLFHIWFYSLSEHTRLRLKEFMNIYSMYWYGEGIQTFFKDYSIKLYNDVCFMFVEH